ncbi:MAG: hypothetical protein RI945_345 [Candidatus Parcubacteria bacterium]
MEYFIIRSCDGQEKSFGEEQAKTLAQKLIDEFGFQKVRVHSIDKKTAKHTAGIIANRFNVGVSCEEGLSVEEYFEYLDRRIKALNGDSLIHIFIVDTETMFYFPKERLGIGKCVVGLGMGIHYRKGEFVPFEYEF